MPVVAVVRERSCKVEETERVPVPVVLAGGKRSLAETANVSEPVEERE